MNQTIIFVVDELDRCLPEYTIKVLERLHHLFDGISNVQVLLSIDIAQLKHVVRQIFGDETDVKNYLRKFIQFEVFLGEGVVNDKFNERFKQYTSHFQVESSSTSAIDVDVKRIVNITCKEMDAQFHSEEVSNFVAETLKVKLKEALRNIDVKMIIK